MAFWGNEFIFDGVPCSEYGLMVYSFGSNTQEDVSFQNGDIIEDRIPGRYDALTYGVVQNQALEYTLIFGADPASMDANDPIDRFEVEAIAGWLTGHQSRKWLVILQEDMEPFRYKCMISELTLITYGDMPWAFSCKVSCDSPFAYTMPDEYTYTVNGTSTVPFFNRSSYNGYYRPVIEIANMGSGTLSIKNKTDGGRTLQFTDAPVNSTTVIRVDNKNQIITGSDGTNLYPYCNMKFLRLLRGDNVLEISGKAQVKLICEFPVNIGG